MYLYSSVEDDNVQQQIKQDQIKNTQNKKNKFLNQRYKNSIRQINIDEQEFNSFRINVNRIEPKTKTFIDIQKIEKPLEIKTSRNELRQFSKLKSSPYVKIDFLKFPKLSLQMDKKNSIDIFIKKNNFLEFKYQPEFNNLPSTRLKILRLSNKSQSINLVIINYYGLLDYYDNQFFNPISKKQQCKFQNLIDKINPFYRIALILQNNQVCQKAYSFLKQYDIDIYLIKQQRNILIDCKLIIEDKKNQYQSVLYFSPIDCQILNNDIILNQKCFINKIPIIQNEKLMIFLFQNMIFSNNDYFLKIIEICLNPNLTQQFENIDIQIFEQFIDNQSLNISTMPQQKKLENIGQVQKQKQQQNYNNLTYRLYYDFKIKNHDKKTSQLYEKISDLVERNRFLAENINYDNKDILQELQDSSNNNILEIQEKQQILQYIEAIKDIIFIQKI